MNIISKVLWLLRLQNWLAGESYKGNCACSQRLSSFIPFFLPCKTWSLQNYMYMYSVTPALANIHWTPYIHRYEDGKQALTKLVRSLALEYTWMMFSTGDLSTFQAQWLASAGSRYSGKGIAHKMMCKTPRRGGRLAEHVTAMTGYVAVTSLHMQLHLQNSGLIPGKAFDSRLDRKKADFVGIVIIINFAIILIFSCCPVVLIPLVLSLHRKLLLLSADLWTETVAELQDAFDQPAGPGDHGEASAKITACRLHSAESDCFVDN